MSRPPDPTPSRDAWKASALASALFEQSPFSSVIYDAAGHPIALNAAFRAMWGVGIESVPPGYSVLHDPELERQGVLPAIRRAFAGESVATPPVRYDIARVSASGAGRAIWTQGHFYPVRDETGTLTHVVLTHTDLTERVQAEEALRASEGRMRLAQRAAHIGVFDWHIPSGRVAWTEEEERIFGLAPGTFEGTIEGWALRVLPEDGERMQREMGDCMARREPEMAFDFRIRRPDGEVRDIEGQAAFLYAEDGSPERMVGVNVDVTDRRRAEAELARLLESERHARSEAEAANRAKSDFLAKMSHELRTPLNAIAGYTEILELGIHGPVTSLQQESLERIRRNQRHLLALIEDILDFSKIEMGAVRLELREVELREVLASLEALIAPQFRAKGVAYRVLPVDPGLRVRADAERVVQVCINLLSNALKATPAGGEVTLSCERTGAGGAVHVRDTGTGIPADHLEAIFNPFTQIGRTLSNPGSGVGLGLSISRELARAMGGDLTVASEPGAGATFTLILPVP